jgi:hypothetical protein
MQRETLELGSGLQPGTTVHLLADMPALRLWDRENGWSTEAPAGTEGEVVQDVVVRRDGVLIWKASSQGRTRAEVVGLDGYEIYIECGPDGGELWVYAQADLVQAVAR